MIVVGRADALSRQCASIAVAARNDNGHGVDNEEQNAPISVCRGLTRPWSQIWPGLRHL